MARMAAHALHHDRVIWPFERIATLGLFLFDIIELREFLNRCEQIIEVAEIGTQLCHAKESSRQHKLGCD